MKKIGALQITTPGDREIVMTRVVDAPRDLVFEAMTKPELLQRWLIGPPGWTMTLCENDLKVGATFRHVWRGPEGQDMAMHGVYREIVRPERIVRTETFDFGCEAQGGEQVATLLFTEHFDKTTITINVLFPSRGARDAAVASGMEQGVAAGYARLDDILAEMKIR